MALQGTDMTGTVHQHPASQPPPTEAAGGGDGGGQNLGGRIATLEAHLQHLATKEDIQRVEKLIAQREAGLLRWLIGIITIALISIFVTLLRGILF